MEYDRIIELDNVIVQDCINLYEKKNIITILSNGFIINFEKET